jgi:hypothetical protein
MWPVVAREDSGAASKISSRTSRDGKSFRQLTEGGRKMRIPDDGDYLVILFRPEISLAWSLGDPGQTFTVGALNYVSKIESDFTGFYNRLKDRSGHFVGIEITPLLGEEYLPFVLSRLPYVETDPNGKLIRVFFSGRPTVDVDVVDDQAFGGRIYEAITGEFAVSLVTDWLSPADIAALKDCMVDWQHIVPAAGVKPTRTP